MKLFIAFILSFNVFAQKLPSLAPDLELLNNIPSWDKTTQKRVKKYAPLLMEISKSLEVDSKLVLSIAWAESHFNPNAVSSANALGIMQVKFTTQEYILNKNNDDIRKIYTTMVSKDVPYHIISNMVSGTLYIKYLLKKFKNRKKAIVAYNMGPTGTRRLIKRKQDLDKHNYLMKIQRNLLALN